LSIDWYLYERKLKINGNTTRDRQINLMKDGIINSFANSPSYRSAYFNGSTTATDIQVVDNNDSDKYYIKTILSEPNETFDAGDIVVVGSLTYLITNIDEDNPIQSKGTMQLCNNTFSFYSTTDSILYSIPCIISSKLTLKEQENNYLSTIDNSFYLIVQNVALTREIEVGNIFKIGLYDYKIESLPDDISVPGILQFKLSYSEQAQETHTYTVTIQNPDTTLYIDDTLTLNIIATDNLQQVSSPTLTYSSSDTDVATVSNGIVTCIAEGVAVISVTFNSITDTLNLTVQSEAISDDYTVLVSSANTVKLGANITLSASVYNNGSLDTNKSVVWNISNQDQSSNSYVTIVSQDGTSITLKATNNNLYVGKYVVVRANKSDDNSIYKEQTIQIKSLF
jgi:hypothetical protein